MNDHARPGSIAPTDRRTARGRAFFGTLCAAALGLAATFGTGTPAAGAATACPNEAIRVQQHSTYLPECRAYELVSTLDSGGYGYNEAPGGGLISSDGDRIAFGSGGALGEEAEGSGAANAYLSTRSPASGWSQRNISPPNQSWGALTPAWYLTFDRDLSNGVAYTNAAVAPGATVNGYSLYVRNLTTGALTLAAPIPNPVDGSRPLVAGLPFAFYASADRRKFAFRSAQVLTADQPGGGQIYAYEAVDGKTKPVGVLPGQTTPAAGSSDLPALWHGMSEDGRRVFFALTPAGGEGHLYVRTDGTTTTQVDAPEVGMTPDPAGPQFGRFLGAAADGSLVIFYSTEKLTADATAVQGSGRSADLYMRNLDDGSIEDLTTSDPNGGGVLGVTAVTDDLGTVYFVAEGQLAPGAEPGGANLYRWHRGTGVSYIATLASGGGDSGDWLSDPARYPGELTARTTPDGSSLLFLSTEKLTGYENAGKRMAYLYNAATGKIKCASCNPDPAVRPTADAALFPDQGQGLSNTFDRGYQPRNISDDGRRVFFETADPLDARRDVNDQIDVYEYDVASGRVSLLSGGMSPFRSTFNDASPDGGEVLFGTRQQLTATTTGGSRQLYVARVDGGFPASPAPAECQGDACQGGAPAPAASAPVAASGAYKGLGNVRQRRNCAKPGRRARRIAHRARRLRRHAARVSRRRRAHHMHRKARRLSKEARRLSRRGKHCRQAGRRAGK